MVLSDVATGHEHEFRAFDGTKSNWQCPQQETIVFIPIGASTIRKMKNEESILFIKPIIATKISVFISLCSVF
ncbi:hypothetical protein AwDysgo_05070 [Bacteroidales bacterium]|nr:hypothetical protein AwDysgo_05070 [Bacteroidales bacterium]